MTEIMPVPRNLNFTVIPAEPPRGLIFVLSYNIMGIAGMEYP